MSIVYLGTNSSISIDHKRRVISTACDEKRGNGRLIPAWLFPDSPPTSPIPALVGEDDRDEAAYVATSVVLLFVVRNILNEKSN